MKEGDTRWIQRGAYDLIGVNDEATHSGEGLPKAVNLYGSLTEQLADPDSFANKLKRILSVRQAYGIASSHQIAVPDVVSPGLLVMVHELPAGRGTQITALNFGATSIQETITLTHVTPGPVVDMINETVEGDLTDNGELTINLEGYEGLCLRIVGALPNTPFDV
jgi:trehalose synthase